MNPAGIYCWLIGVVCGGLEKEPGEKVVCIGGGEFGCEFVGGNMLGLYTACWD